MERKIGNTTSAIKSAIARTDIEDEKRDITDLWAEALSDYDGIVGFDLKPTFVNADSMIANGEKAMNEFHRFRHDEKKVDKLRTIFSSNMSLIEMGAKQLVHAATPAFPPAAAIGTALTFVLSACKSVSADYDVVTAFFEDMNNFLQRVTILVKRSPQNIVWQKTLLNVFTSFLKMCGFAHKYIQKGRFRKWVTNLISGEDGELAGARKGMDTSLHRLQAATEFATLGNTEELKRMNDELRENQDAQLRLAESQSVVLQSLLEQQSGIQDDMKRLMQLLEQQKKDDKSKSKTTKTQKEATVNPVRSALTEIFGVDAEIQTLRESFVPNTAQWIFEEENWKVWSASKPDSPFLLMVRGPAGIGKSHLALSAADRLRQVNDTTEGHLVSVTYFPCREANSDLKFCSWVLVSLIVQVSEQNLEIRERLHTIISNDAQEIEDDDSWDVWIKLFVPVFGRGSKYLLYMVIDGLDELEDDEEREELLRCMKDVQDKGLRIKIFCTTRPDIKPEFVIPGSVDVNMTKEKILPDLQHLVWNRMQNYATEYQGLTRFSKYVKQRIASRMEEVADGLLYTEHMLRYLARMTREAIVVRELEEAMPKDITDLFSTMLSQSQRRTPTGQFATIRLFLAWISFSFRPLTLDEAIQIVKTSTATTARRIGRIERFDLEDEVQLTYSRFLQVGSSNFGTSESIMSPASMMQDFRPRNTADEKPIFNDGSLEIRFRERSMREFFSNAIDGEESLRTPSSTAHKWIFMSCYRIIKMGPSSSDSDQHSNPKSLYEYALQNCLSHWMAIDMMKLSDEDNLQIAQTFASLFSDSDLLATGLESLGGDNTLANQLMYEYDEWEAKTKQWRDWLAGKSVSVQALGDGATKEVIIDFGDAPAVLTRCHIENWLAAPDAAAALRSYRFARGAASLSEKLKSLLDEDYEDDEEVTDTDENMDLFEGEGTGRSKEEIIGLSNAFDIKKTSNAYFAVAVILNSRGNREEAAQNLEIAIETCHSPFDQFRNYEFLAFIYWELERSEEALYFVDLCLRSADNIPDTAMCRAHVTRARALFQQQKGKDALDAFRTARLHDLTQVPIARFLYEEHLVYLAEEDYEGFMNVLQEWRPIERLTFLTWNYEWDEWIEPEKLAVLYAIAQKSGRVDQLIETLEEVVKSLDLENASAPLRNNLAWTYWRLRGDPQTAKTILDIVLLNASEGYLYKLTDQLPTPVAWRAGNMMTDILYQEFQASCDPSIKSNLFEESKSIRQKPLLQSVQTPPSSVAAHLLILARMARKLGPVQDFERFLRQVFDGCIEALRDPAITRHSASAYHIALALHQLEMQKDANIWFSAMFYTFKGPTTDNESEGKTLEGDCEKINDENIAGDKENLEIKDAPNNTNEHKIEPEHVSSGGDHLLDHDAVRTVNVGEARNSPATSSRKPAADQTVEVHESTGQVGIVSPSSDAHSDEEAEEEESDDESGSDDGTDDGSDEAESTTPIDSGENNDQERVYDLDDTVELHCRGVCLPDRIIWTSWNIEETGRMYQCLYCTECRLCQGCYDTRMRYNKDGRKENEQDFCCNNGRYLIGPMEGWQGIKDGIIYIKNEEPIVLRDYIPDTEKRWKETWVEFWKG